MPEPEPGGLDHGIANQTIASLGDTLAASAVTAVIGTGRETDIVRDLSPIGEVAIINLPGEDGGKSRADALQT